MSDSRPTTSTKPWASKFEFSEWECYPITQNSFVNPPNFSPLDDADEIRLQQAYTLPNKDGPELLVSEPDVHTFFAVYIYGGVRFAWQRLPWLWPRWHVAPATSENASFFVDLNMQAHPNQKDMAYQAGTAGELKKPGVIYAREWRKEEAQSTNSRRLGQELRGYAYHYHSHQVWCFDGLHLLIHRYECQDQEAIKVCNPKVWVIPVNSTFPDVTVREALYHLVKDGFQRLAGPLALDREKVVAGYRLYRAPYSGQIMWQNAQTGFSTWNHPHLSRVLNKDKNCWEWTDNNGIIHHTENSHPLG